jgi:predicted CxxxxCH...CXXCH cytochrome family protein
MKKFSVTALIILTSFIFIFSRCNQGKTDKTEITKDSTQAQTTAALPAYDGFESQVAWGKHIVTIAGCNDCHTPKKMGPAGPEDNMDLELSGNPSQVGAPDINLKEIESKGLVVINPTFTSFAGPWGVSFASNITSDSTTGIGNWTEDQFILCIRKGKKGGVPGGRNLLPPMPWQNVVSKMTDDELKAVYAYLQSTKPIHNIVPQPQPPVLPMKK